MDNSNCKSNKLVFEKNSHQLYWDDLDKVKFLGLLSLSSLLFRTCFHPFALLKTRLQTNPKCVHLKTFEMVKDIYLKEGIKRGFYRGYSVSLCALLFEPLFISTLEITRTFLNNNRYQSISQSQWDLLTSSISGGTAALIQQSFLVPIDVVTQRVMITRSRDGVQVIDVIRDIYSKSPHPIKSFYKGYFITIGTSVPFNSIIWTIYWKIQKKLEKILPSKCDPIISPLSSTIASLLTSILTQPIDVLKTRLQVASKRQSLRKTFSILINERGFKGLFVGSLPRACIVIPNSVIMMSLYEIIKRASSKNVSQ